MFVEVGFGCTGAVLCCEGTIHHVSMAPFLSFNWHPDETANLLSRLKPYVYSHRFCGCIESRYLCLCKVFQANLTNLMDMDGS